MFTNLPLENENNRDQKALQPSSMMYLGLLSLNNSNTREWASCRILFSILLEHDEIYQHNRPPPPSPHFFLFLAPSFLCCLLCLGSLPSFLGYFVNSFCLILLLSLCLSKLLSLVLALYAFVSFVHFWVFIINYSLFYA